MAIAGHARRLSGRTAIFGCSGTADGETLVAHMLHDKKMDAGTLPFLLARRIGGTFLDTSVDLADVRAFLER